MYVKTDGTIENKLIETTVGRVLFNQHVPKEVGYINAFLPRKTFVKSSVTSSKLLMFQKLLNSLMISRHLVSVWHSMVVCRSNINDLIIPDIKQELLEKQR